jgi:D-galactarolactone isomerase
MKGDRIAQLESLLAKLPCPLVIDHLGRVPPAAGPDHPGFAAVRRLLDRGNTYVKLSGAYHDSVSGPPAYADMAPIARTYAAAAPERMVWGSDWPHPTVPAAADKPDDAHLLDLLLDWVPDEGARRRVLVDNPEKLYGFTPLA